MPYLHGLGTSPIAPRPHPAFYFMIVPAATFECFGVVHSATVSVHLWMQIQDYGPPFNIWVKYPINTTQYWGTVSAYRAGYLDVWVIPHDPQLCYAYYTEATVTWNDIYARPQGVTRYSQITRYTGNNLPC